MAQKARGPSRKKHRNLPPVGAQVANSSGKLHGADPFEVLVVTGHNRDGTLEVAVLGGGREWHHVDPRDVTDLASM